MIRLWLILLLLKTEAAKAQIPETGDFRYLLFDNSDNQVGTYSFTISRQGPLWLVSSEMDVDTRVYFLRVRLHDKNRFTHDGKDFQSFAVQYFKDIPLSRTMNVQVEGERMGNSWHIRGNLGERTITEPFDEVRNLVSRLIRPEAVLKPGEKRKTRSLDPLTLDIGTVESQGTGEEIIEFQGKKRTLYLMEMKASDGDVHVKKFANGLIYRSQTSHGYALLQSAQTPNF